MSVKHEMVRGNGEKAVGVWDPFREFFPLRSPLSRFFDEPFFGFARPDWTLGLKEPKMPAIDVKETEKEYILTADLPGVDKKDIDVQIKNNVLSLKGERKSDKEEKGKNFIRQEHSYGSFFRSLALPEDVKAADVKAAYKDGVLTLKIPRMEGAKPKSVKINVE